jgi:hypothetical protein
MRFKAFIHFIAADAGQGTVSSETKSGHSYGRVSTLVETSASPFG